MNTVYAPKTGLYLPGTNGNYISTPDHVDLNPSGDLSFIFKFKPLELNRQEDLFSKSLSDPNRFFRVYKNTNDELTLGLFPTGSVASGNLNFIFSLADWEGAAKTISYIGLVLDIDNGNSQSEVKLFLNVEGQWEYKTSKYNSAVASLAGSNQPLVIGEADFIAYFKGNVELFEFYSGIGDGSAPGLGTLVAEFDASKCKPRYRDSTGKVWSITGSDVVTEKVYHD